MGCGCLCVDALPAVVTDFNCDVFGCWPFFFACFIVPYGCCGFVQSPFDDLAFMHDFCLFGICESYVYWTVHHLDS